MKTDVQYENKSGDVKVSRGEKNGGKQTRGREQGQQNTDVLNSSKNTGAFNVWAVGVNMNKS